MVDPWESFQDVSLIFEETNGDQSMLKIGQAAKLWQVSPTKVKQWIVTGRIEAVNVGSVGKRPQYRIHPDAIMQLRPDQPEQPQRTSRRVVNKFHIDI